MVVPRSRDGGSELYVNANRHEVKVDFDYSKAED